MTSARLLLACLLATSGIASASARPAPVALTFDDLPALTLKADQSEVDRITRKLVSGLERRHVPAIGFVVAGKIEELDPRRQTSDLKSWMRAGLQLGNHTWSHDSPNALGAKAWIEDVAHADAVLRPLLASEHQRLTWFRHPYLETGSPAAAKAEMDRWLTDHGYRVAPVTIDADDWEFAEPYDDAVARHDKAEIRTIRASYLKHTERVVEWSRVAGRSLFGREIAQVLLLHASRLNADCLGDLLGILRRQQLRPATLAEAMADPAYSAPDTYAGPDGVGWLERWARTSGKELPWDSLDPVPHEIEVAYDRVDPDRKPEP